METIVGENIDGIVFPMVESSIDIQIFEWYLSTLEKEKNLPVGKIDVIPLIETAKGVSNISEILKHNNRVKRVAFGAGDFTNDLTMIWSKTGEELLYARSKLIIESRNAGIEAPIDTVYIDLADHVNFRNETVRAKHLGFQGKLLIHPQQIKDTMEIFAPTDAEIEQAKKIIKAFKMSESIGNSSIKVDEQFVDYPIYNKAMKLLKGTDNDY